MDSGVLPVSGTNGFFTAFSAAGFCTADAASVLIPAAVGAIPAVPGRWWSVCSFFCGSGCVPALRSCDAGRLAEDSAAGLLCGPRDSCDTGADAVMLPIADGVAGFLLCRSEEAGDVCATVCGGFSALPLCTGIGRCETCCSAGRAASGRAVERGGVPASRLEDGAAGDTGAAGAECSRFVERPSMRAPLDGCTVLPDCWAET